MSGRGWPLALPAAGSLTHLTGALLRGWWVPPLPAGLPVFAAISKDEARPRRPGLSTCRHRGDIPCGELEGLRVATATQILLAAARALGLLDLVVLIDAALRLGDCTLPEMWQASGRRRGLLHQLCDVPVDPQSPILDGDGVAWAARCSRPAFA